MEKIMIPDIEKTIDFSGDDIKKEFTLLDEIKIAFFRLGPKGSFLDIRPVLKDKKYRLNWWSKKSDGDNSIVFSIFITVEKTATGYSFINETLTVDSRPSPKIDKKL